MGKPNDGSSNYNIKYATNILKSTNILLNLKYSKRYLTAKKVKK